MFARCRDNAVLINRRMNEFSRIHRNSKYILVSTKNVQNFLKKYPRKQIPDAPF
jgi:hypothetical protein